MKQFLTIFNFELIGHMKNKVFIGLTVAIVIGLALLLSFPRLSDFLSKHDIELPSGDDDKTKIVIVNGSNVPNDLLSEAFKSGFIPEKYEITFDDGKTEKDISDSVKSGDFDSGMLIVSPKAYKYIVDTVDMYSVESQMASQILLNINRYMLMAEKGLTEDEIAQVLDSNIDCETIVTGKDQTESFLYTYAIVMVLYIVLLMYGQFVSTGVAAEKSTRAMEVLITSAKSLNLMFGKVLGAGCAGLIQLVIILFSGVGFYKLNEGYIDNEIISSIFNMPTNAIAFTILFFVTGFFIYAFMYGAAGSLATRTEDLNILSMPITVIYMMAFFVAIFGMNGGNVDGTFMKVCSYLPTFAPTIMLVRVCMGNVSALEIIVSVVIQLLSIFGLGVLCAKIYRAGVLLYGNTPKPKDIFKILKEADF